MDKEQIAAAWALVNAATEGPWRAESGHEQSNGQLYWQVTDGDDAIMQNQFCWCQGDHAANAAFIAASRTLIPQLLTALEAERAKVARLVSIIKNIDANLAHFLDRRPKQLMAPETVEFLRQMNIAALASIKGSDHE